MPGIHFLGFAGSTYNCLFHMKTPPEGNRHQLPSSVFLYAEILQSFVFDWLQTSLLWVELSSLKAALFWKHHTYNWKGFVKAFYDLSFFCGLLHHPKSNQLNPEPRWQLFRLGTPEPLGLRAWLFSELRCNPWGISGYFLIISIAKGPELFDESCHFYWKVNQAW